MARRKKQFNALIASDDAVAQFKQSFGQLLMGIRNERGWSRNTVAIRAGVQPAQVKQVEEGQRQYTVDTFARVCAAIGIEVEFITKDPSDHDAFD